MQPVGQTVNSKLPWVSRLANLAILAMGALVLAGWAFNQRWLIELFPTVVAMNPVTALAFLLLGLCALRLTGKVRQDAVTLFLAGIVVLLGLARLLDHMVPLGFHVDQFLFPAKVVAVGRYPPNEMAVNTALNFLLCGLALLLFNSKLSSGFYPAQGLVLVAGWITLLALIGYTYRVLLFYRLGAGLPMSLDTAIGFALFIPGFFLAQPERGIMGIVTSPTVGGGIARRLLPMAILIPWAVGAALLVLEQAGLYGQEFTVALFAVVTIILFTALIWRNTQLLYRADLKQAKAERDRLQASQELQRSNTELQQFAYVASHDLFEPLRMVTSYLQLLEQKCAANLGPQGVEFLHFALDGAKRMDALIQDLLGYARLERRGRRFEPADCEEIFKQSVANLKVAMEETGTTVTHEPLPTVQGDPVQLTQVFQNLIGNAIKFRGERPPRLEVRAERRGDHWLFVVRDNGIGIDPRFFNRIFDIFQRLHTRSEYPGTGIGLAVCKKIIERHGGRIWVESVAGEGSSFFFTLPA